MSPLGFPVGLGLAAAKSTGYQIGQSLRFDGSSYLSWTPGSAGNRRTSTFSVWFKPTTTGGEGVFLNATGYTKISIDNGGFDKIWFLDYAGGFNFNVNPSGSYRDPSAWYHLVAVLDTTNATSTERVKIYINGVRLDTFDTNSQPSQNFETDWANNVQHRIGADTNPFYFNGYMAECHFVDGTALDPTDFGEYNNGVWRPKRYTGSHGTNGFYLKFDPTATNGIGHDHSGNGNHWTPSGFTADDTMSDTPTTNFPTFNPLLPGPSNFSEGNLSVTANSSASANRGTPNPTFKMPSSGKYYAEFTPTTIGEMAIALTQEGNGDTVISYYRLGTISLEGSGTVGTGSSYTTGDVIGVAVDVDNTTVRFYKNGTAQLSSATDYSSAPDSDNCYLTFKQGSSSGSCTATANYGQRAFEYGPPTGFKALNTSNLPAPTVKDGSKYFNTVLYTGNGSLESDTQAITGVGFQPDFLWVKGRSVTSGGVIWDAVRGVSRRLAPHVPNAENTSGDWLSSFDTDGFTAKGNANNANALGETFVAWNWLAGGSGSSNTVGSIYSTVNANPSAGFSIVGYTGTGTAGTVGHGLGVAPSFYVVKNRDDGTLDWGAYHSSLGATKRLILSTPANAVTDSTFWNNTEPTSTTFSVGTAGNTNGNTKKMIAYCFAEVEGYSKFGSYIGNANPDGPFVFCGFKPAMVIYKNASTTSDWTIVDSARSPYNEVDIILDPSNTTTEGSFGTTNRNIDFLSNGFKIRSTAAGGTTALNGSSNTMVFMAFAENPFGGTGVSPATAR